MAVYDQLKVGLIKLGEIPKWRYYLYQLIPTNRYYLVIIIQMLVYKCDSYQKKISKAKIMIFVTFISLDIGSCHDY